MKGDERLANLRAASVEDDILDKQYNFDKWYWLLMNIEVKYLVESQIKKYYCQSNLFL